MLIAWNMHLSHLHIAPQGKALVFPAMRQHRAKTWTISPYKSPVTSWVSTRGIIDILWCLQVPCSWEEEGAWTKPVLVWGFNPNTFTFPVKICLAVPQSAACSDTSWGKRQPWLTAWKTAITSRQGLGPAHTWSTPSLGEQTALEMLLVSLISYAMHDQVTSVTVTCFNFALVLLERGILSCLLT